MKTGQKTELPLNSEWYARCTNSCSYRCLTHTQLMPCLYTLLQPEREDPASNQPQTPELLTHTHTAWLRKYIADEKRHVPLIRGLLAYPWLLPAEAKDFITLRGSAMDAMRWIVAEVEIKKRIKAESQHIAEAKTWLSQPFYLSISVFTIHILYPM